MTPLAPLYSLVKTPCEDHIRHIYETSTPYGNKVSGLLERPSQVVFRKLVENELAYVGLSSRGLAEADGGKNVP